MCVPGSLSLISCSLSVSHSAGRVVREGGRRGKPDRSALSLTNIHTVKQAVVNMLLRILSLKDQPPYGAPVPEQRHKLPDALDGVHLLSPSLQTWLIERIRCVVGPIQ